ncbi:DNA-methyltransferase [Desulfonema magnum]|nr:site-specific DNA-methyltransferase [Desulfonema magnum]
MFTQQLIFNSESISNSEISISDTFSESERIILHTGDTYAFLRTVPSDLSMLIITSPPYNVGKAYEIRTSIDHYLKQQHASKRFSGRYETMLWFTKSDNYKFNLDSVRVPSKYPGKRYYKGKNKGKISGNPLGKNPSDIWELVAKEWDKELWDIPNVKSNHPEKTEHPCQFPIELVERSVLAFTDEEDVVLDPYCGVASSLIAGLKHNRRVVGCEKDRHYVEIGKNRIYDFYAGKLKIRPLGKPVHKPTGREKVSQRPKEWQELNRNSDK